MKDRYVSSAPQNIYVQFLVLTTTYQQMQESAEQTHLLNLSNFSEILNFDVL